MVKVKETAAANEVDGTVFIIRIPKI